MAVTHRVALVVSIVALSGACGLSTIGSGLNAEVLSSGDATVGAETSTSDGGQPTPPDATIFGVDGGADADLDAGVIDAADADAGPVFGCNDAGVTSCSACAGKPSLCAATNTCVQQCSTDCAGSRVACFRCSDAGAVTGTCEAENDAGYCMNGSYAPGLACPCGAGGDASACPGDFQKCLQDDAGAWACHSCGEAVTSGAAKCKNGKACDFNGNATDHLTCH